MLNLEILLLAWIPLWRYAGYWFQRFDADAELRQFNADAEFRQFESMEWGYRALFVLLHTYARRHGCRTLRSMVARYAPPHENPTGNYLRFVCAESGLGADEPLDTLDRRTMTAVAAAISRFENGPAASAGEVARGWELFFADFAD